MGGREEKRESRNCSNKNERELDADVSGSRQEERTAGNEDRPTNLVVEERKEESPGTDSVMEKREKVMDVHESQELESTDARVDPIENEDRQREG